MSVFKLRPSHFRHGVHPPEHKELTASKPIRRMRYPSEVVIPLRQHAGKPAKLVVRVGDYVERGDTLAVADGFVSAPVHASAAGRIAVAPFSAQVPRPRLVPHWETLTGEDVVKAVQDGGVVGLGGAAFPT